MSNEKKLEEILSKNRSKHFENVQNKYQNTLIFMASLFIIGIMLTIVSWDIDTKLEDSLCKSKSLKTSNKIVLCIGITLMVSALSFYSCSTSCDSVIAGVHYVYYIILMFILGIILIVLGSIISSESSKVECVNTASPSIIWGLGLIIVLGCGFYFYTKIKDNL